MIQNSIFPAISSFVNDVIITVLVIALIFFIIVILIVYKLIHSNVNYVMKRSEKFNNIVVQNTLNPPENNELKEIVFKNEFLKCRYCDEQVQKDVNFCPFCGSFLK
ncbi:MAG: hypothetical protein ACFFFB_21235 [Candidatus Heimdallarchaeota archaeon]